MACRAHGLQSPCIPGRQLISSLLQRIEALYTALTTDYERVVADERLAQQRTSELAQVRTARCSARASGGPRQSLNARAMRRS